MASAPQIAANRSNARAPDAPGGKRLAGGSRENRTLGKQSQFIE